MLRSPRPATGGQPETRIPLSYDWEGNGGFRMFYMPSKHMTEDDKKLIKAQMNEIQSYGEAEYLACEVEVKPE